MFHLALPQENTAFLRGLASNFAQTYQQGFMERIRSAIGSAHGDDPIWEPIQLARGLIDAITFPSSSIPDDLMPMLKRLILDERFTTAHRLEGNKTRTNNPFLHDQYDRELAKFDPYFVAEWFLSTVAYPRPNLADYLNLEAAEKLDDVAFEKRAYDEKFHILQAPALFLPDLGYFRRKCGIRRKPVAVAFIDIDDFKTFNGKHGETNIDRNFLPVFMSALEAEVFQHGYAYRFGGDEYAVLMPNSTLDQAVGLLVGFQDQIRQLQYVNMTERATVSIGLCVADQDSHLTDREMLHKAEQAKNFVKKNLKGRIGVYKTDLFRSEDLEILESSLTA